MSDKGIMTGKEIIFKDQNDQYIFYCPGCGNCHIVDDKWNVDLKSFTISPSVLCKTPRPKGMKICHSFVRNGKIQFLNDCTHELAGKTVDMVSLK